MSMEVKEVFGGGEWGLFGGCLVAEMVRAAVILLLAVHKREGGEK